MNPTPEQGVVTRQAVEWHQRIQLGGLDRDLRRELRVWLQSPAHLEELARICLVDALLQRAVKNGTRRELPKNVIDFDSYAPVTRPRPRPAQQPAARSARSNIRNLAIAASTVLAIIAMFWASLTGTDTTTKTAAGRWDKQLLKDGTVVYVAPKTEMRIQFTDETREVTLVQGQALFEVAKEPSRPFIVATNAGTVRAVGTAFSTSDRGDTVVVNVVEGRVAITGKAIHGGVQPMIHATANQQVVLSPSGVSAPVSIDADHELMWIRDWYEYQGERVGDIVMHLNSLNEAQVIVDDPQVLRLRVNFLAFKPSQPEYFVREINLWYVGYSGKTSANALRLHQP